MPFIRPAHLASDGASKWDVFRHLVETLEAQDDCAVDVLVDLDSGVPLRLPEDVDNTVDVLLSGDADVAITAYEAERNPYFNMVEHRNGGAVTIVKQPRDTDHLSPARASRLQPVSCRVCDPEACARSVFPLVLGEDADPRNPEGPGYRHRYRARLSVGGVFDSESGDRRVSKMKSRG